MSRYVDAYEVAKALHEEVEQIDCGTTYAVPEGYIDLIVSRVPSADVAEVRHGKWIFHKPFDNGRKNCNECIECSQCHTWFGYDCYAKTPYCPNCGARMDGEKDDE